MFLVAFASVIAIVSAVTPEQSCAKFKDAQNAMCELQSQKSKKMDSLLKRVDNLEKLLLLNLDRISGRLYYFGETNKNWQDARQECISYGGDLAAKGIRESQTFNELYKIGVNRGRSYWIGLNDLQVEERFDFVDGVVASPEDSYWDPKDPNDNRRIEHCMEMRTHEEKKVSDLPCHLKIPPLCEFTFQ